MPDWDYDQAVRLAAINFIRDLIRKSGDDLRHADLSGGFTFRGERIHVIGPEGIFKPRVLDVPLTIKTVPKEVGKKPPYDDAWDRDGSLLYRYRGSDRHHADNVGLAIAMQRQLPLIYLHGITTGHYVASCPAYVIGDDPGRLTFKVALDAGLVETVSTASDVTLTRGYASRVVRQRLHQASFRQRVLAAYSRQCAMCRLRHEELLDAAHIVGDTEPEGEPAVSNGLALCKLHHAAFDNQIVGIRPDFVIEVRSDVLSEHDGPMLLHGLQGMAGRSIEVPRDLQQRPSRTLLEQRFEIFRKAG